MARLEMRQFGAVKHLLVIAETDEESKLMAKALGNTPPYRVEGEMVYSDEHYIRFKRGKFEIGKEDR